MKILFMNRIVDEIIFIFEKLTRHQIGRYAVVGILNNLRGYLTYLLLTWLWLDPKVAVSLMYPLGAFFAYFGHARYSFSYVGSKFMGAIRYFFAHLVGYLSNIGILYLLSDKLGYPHQLVQLLAITMVAGLLFILFRYFVFPRRPQPSICKL